jgi:hypothetical protein
MNEPTATDAPQLPRKLTAEQEEEMRLWAERVGEKDRRETEARVAAPIERTSSAPIDFWEMTEGDESETYIHRLVEREVYRALREAFHTPSDPNFVLSFPWPSATRRAEGREGWGVNLWIDGSGFRDIEAYFDLGDMLEMEIDQIDPKEMTEEEEAAVRRLARRMRESLDKLDAYLTECGDGKVSK